MRLLSILVIVLLVSALPGVTPLSWQYLPNTALLVAAVASLSVRRGQAVILAIVVGVAAGICSADPITFQPFLCLMAVFMGQLFWKQGRGSAPLLQILSVVFLGGMIECIWRSAEWGGVASGGAASQQALHAGITLLFCPIAIVLSESSTS